MVHVLTSSALSSFMLCFEYKNYATDFFLRISDLFIHVCVFHYASSSLHGCCYALTLATDQLLPPYQTVFLLFLFFLFCLTRSQHCSGILLVRDDGNHVVKMLNWLATEYAWSYIVVHRKETSYIIMNHNDWNSFYCIANCEVFPYIMKFCIWKK